jgi:hypothetical protein
MGVRYRLHIEIWNLLQAAGLLVGASEENHIKALQAFRSADEI